MRGLVLLLGACATAAQSQELLEAARAGKTQQVAALIEKGGSLEARDREGRTALMLAAGNGRTATVRLLLAKGADANARDHHGWSAYMLALLDPAGGLRAHEAVLRLLPEPQRYRLTVNAMWSPEEGAFQSCFLRPENLSREMRAIRPDGLALEAFQRYAVASGRERIAIVQSDALGTSEVPNKTAPEDIDATLLLTVTPEVKCGYQADRVGLSIQATLARPGKDGRGLPKPEARGDTAANARQYAAVLAQAAKRQAGPLYWAVVAPLMEER